MDAMMRIRFLLVFLAGWLSLEGQQMNWARLAEDTVYYAREYFPDRQMVSQPGMAQTWDFRSLRAPYAISRRIMVNGERDRMTYGTLMNGNKPVGVLNLQGSASSLVQTFEDNPVCADIPLTFQYIPVYKPFFKGVLGEHATYKGRMMATFAWPRHLSCGWTPAQIPDSCRITYTLAEEINVDGEGTLYLPTEVSKVYRQYVTRKKAARVEVRHGATWVDITSIVPGIKLIANFEFVRFVSAETGMLLAEIETKEDGTPVRIEFKTHPMATRIFQEEPDRPDIYAFPNPSFDIVRFQLSDLPAGPYKLRIFNILGTPVRETEIRVDDPRTTISMDLGDLERGTYLYRLQDRNGRTIKTKRIMLIQT